MNRAEFLQRLEQALRGMPADERRRAMEYYESYFDEAGPENEAEVIRNLGAPEKVAADILRDFGDVSVPPASERGGAREKARAAGSGFRSLDSGQKLLLIVLLAVAAICIVPGVIAVVGGIGGVLLALLCVLIAVFVIVPALSVAAWASGIGLAVAAVVSLFTRTLPEVLLFLGLALICIALGILLWRLTVLLFRRTFPAIVDSIAGLFRRIFHTSQN